MSLTEEEKDELRLTRAEAKSRCRETWEVILQTRKILTSYENDHFRWLSKFEKADRKLAEEEKMTKLMTGKKKVNVTLTQEQIQKIADELGVEVNFGKGKEDD